MPTYFFDVFDGRGHHADQHGIDLRSEAEVEDEAVALAHAIMGEGLSRATPEAVSVAVRAADGRTVFSARMTLAGRWAGQSSTGADRSAGP